MPRTDAKHAEVVRAAFSSIWPVHLTAFTRLLRHLRESFDGDLDLLLVLATIADGTPRDRWAASLDDPELITQHGSDATPQSPINVQSISDFTGIPRETVRRKVAVLRERKWVTKDAGRNLFVNRQAGVDLADATEATVAYLAAIRSALEAAGPGGTEDLVSRRPKENRPRK